MYHTCFFGTSDRSTPILDALHKDGNLKACITKEDTKVGRDQTFKETEVKRWAKSNCIPFFCLSDIKKQTPELIAFLHEYNAHIGIVADFSFLIPDGIIKSLPKGIINIHFSLLPKYRGASPIQHAILNGELETGITYYLMDQRMDTGDILVKSPYKIEGKSTAQQLNHILFAKASKEICHVVDLYSRGSIVPQGQDHKSATYCYSRANPKSTLVDKRDALIDWNCPADYIERMIRAFIPWPTAYTTLGKLENNDKICTKIHLKPSTNRDLQVKILEAELDGKKLCIKKIQLEGKRETDWKSFLNGYAEV